MFNYVGEDNGIPQGLVMGHWCSPRMMLQKLFPPTKLEAEVSKNKQ